MQSVVVLQLVDLHVQLLSKQSTVYMLLQLPLRREKNSIIQFSKV